jgi:CheY-like chemotaxis protein
VIVASQSGDERKALSLGADAYLAKPVDRARLVSELERVTARSGDHLALIIDDDEAARYVLRRSLRAPMKSQEAHDGPSGLAAASRLRPQVIFLDLSMPGMTGDEVLDRLKADPATAAIPVIIVTSMELDSTQRQRLGRQARAILHKKDLSIETLARTLDSIAIPSIQ